MKQEILTVSRQTKIGELSPWFSATLDELIERNLFDASTETLEHIQATIIDQLEDYRVNQNVSTAAIGISGGVDSALTAALFKAAGWNVVGLIMPIHQNPEETERGIEVAEALGIENRVVKLENAYQQMVKILRPTKLGVDKGQKIRNGNIRARLRMITLYNEANYRNGLVGSTDNFSELSAGFWTICGDVGDVAPIQSLWKSFEVPLLARLMNVPESVVTATPTDGLGIDNGDEAQFGCSYLEWDIMLAAELNGLDLSFEDDYRAKQVFNLLTSRMKASKFKRVGTVNLDNGVENRYTKLENYER